MTGLERTTRLLAGNQVDRLPIVPVMHSALAPLSGVPLGEFYTDANAMARVLADGCRTFGLDGVQLSLGVTGEAEALGARVTQPTDGGAILEQHLLADLGDVGTLADRDPTVGGRMPMFFDATRAVVRDLRDEAFVIATLRGPLLLASQLRGVEQMLMDALDDPEGLAAVLDFATEVALRLGRWLVGSGAHGLLLGEATCSPNFISPALYRELVFPRHTRLVAGLKAAGWQAVGLHVCGQTMPIIEDILATGVDFFDVDYQVPAADAIAVVGDRAAMRGNLDPASVFRFGTTGEVRSATQALCEAAAGARWILSSGCDIPPGTPAENVAAFVRRPALSGRGDATLRLRRAPPRARGCRHQRFVTVISMTSRPTAGSAVARG